MSRGYFLISFSSGGPAKLIQAEENARRYRGKEAAKDTSVHEEKRSVVTSERGLSQDSVGSGIARRNTGSAARKQAQEQKPLG
jgi:hypothetical protein